MKNNYHYLLALLVCATLGLTACDDDFEVVSGPGCTSVKQSDGSTKTTCPNGCIQTISADGNTQTTRGPCATSD